MENLRKPSKITHLKRVRVRIQKVCVRVREFSHVLCSFWSEMNKKLILRLLFSCSVVSDSLPPHGRLLSRLHRLLELAQTHVHWVGDASQPSHLLLSPFPPIFNLSQNQGLFQWVSSLHQTAKILEFQLQHQSFQCIFRNDFLWDWLVWSPCSPTDSQDSSPAPQFKTINSSVLSLLFGPTLTSIHDYWKNYSLD